MPSPKRSGSSRRDSPRGRVRDDESSSNNREHENLNLSVRELLQRNHNRNPSPPPPPSSPSSPSPSSSQRPEKPSTSSQKHRKFQIDLKATRRLTTIGTRGYFIPPYRKAEHYAQALRPTNPTRPLPERRTSSDPSLITVGFYHCVQFNFGHAYLSSPDLPRLLSASVAFLGECQILDTPQAALPQDPNAGYRGLDVVAEKGGYHLHFPDTAGPRPFNGDVGVDWERVMRVHRERMPGTVLLVGVGVGEPGWQCCQ